MSSEQKISYDLKRFAGIKRDYTPDEVERLRGSIKIEYSLCKQQSVKLWKLLNTENYIKNRYKGIELAQINGSIIEETGIDSGNETANQKTLLEVGLIAQAINGKKKT